MITFENCSLKNLDCFSSSHPLQEIILQDTVVEDGRAIGRLQELKSLTLNGASIHNLEVVAHSSSLETLKGSFQQFSLLKELFHQAIDFFTIIGEMTDEEEDVWHQYLDVQRV